MKKIVFKIAGLIFLFVLAVWFANQIKDNDVVLQIVHQFGYMGVFVLAFVSGFNVIVPIPVASFLPVFTQAGLGTIELVAIMSIGMTCGDSIGYLLGRLGRQAVERSSWPTWLQNTETFLNRYKYGLPVFLFLHAGFVPLPNEIVVIPAAVTEHKWWAVMVPVFLGNIVLNTLIVLGISSIF